jgi:arylsulfatase A-like enzyme
MKNVLVSVMLITATLQQPAPSTSPPAGKPAPTSANVIIITIDGFRWQEVFNGADSSLLHNEDATPGSEILTSVYWDASLLERRKKLLPFFWNILAAKGQLYGNRAYNNKVNVSNNYALSYPGYNEMFTGHADPAITSNSKYYNPNINILEYLDAKAAFKGRVAAFTSWDVFPYILNEKRNNLPVNSGYDNIDDNNLSATQAMTNIVQQAAIPEKTSTRFDQLTFIAAKEYIRQHHPRVTFIGLGETDEFAHDGRYDLYLQQASQTDRMIAELWHWVQTTPGYKDNTTLIITTDHGRGRKNNRWSEHGSFIKGSSETWLAVIGPGIKPLGEMKEEQQLYQQQLAQTIAGILGEYFETGQPIAAALPLQH